MKTQDTVLETGPLSIQFSAQKSTRPVVVGWITNGRLQASMALLLMLVWPVWVSAATETDATADPAIQALYGEHCAVCHGERGDGKSRARYGLNPPPRDFTSARAWVELTPERIKTSIRYGRPGTGMVAWESKLSAEQIDGLAGFIRSTFMQPPQAITQSTAQSNVAPTNNHPQSHTGGRTTVAAGSPEGARLYKKHCAACHGDKGSGAQWTQYSLNPAPRDFTAAVSRTELSRERMLTSVTHGRPGTAMMSFKKRLSAEQIETIVDFIRTEFMKIEPVLAQSPQLPQADMTLAFPHGLEGDRNKGQAFYQSNCFTCHGLEGLGNGPRSKFINPRPRNFVAAESRRVLNRPALFIAISRGKQGTVMPAWSTVLNNQQIADVAEYVFQTFILGQQKAAPVEPLALAGEKKKALN